MDNFELGNSELLPYVISLADCLTGPQRLNSVFRLVKQDEDLGRPLFGEEQWAVSVDRWERPLR